MAGPRYPEAPTAQELLEARERYLAVAPDRADAWYLLGDHVFHYGWVLNVPNPEERALESFRRASEIDSSYVVGYLHALPLALSLGDTAAARRFERLRLASDTSRYWYVLHRWQKAYALGDSARGRAIADSIDLSQYVYGMDQIAFYDGTGAPDVQARHRHRAARRRPDDPARRGIERLAHDFELVAGRRRRRWRTSSRRRIAPTDVNIPILEVRDALIADGDTTAALEGARALAALGGGVPSRATRRDAPTSARRRACSSRGVSPTAIRRRRAEASIAFAPSRARSRARAESTPRSRSRRSRRCMRMSTRSPDLRAATLRLDSLLRVLDYADSEPGANVVRESRRGAIAGEAGRHARGAHRGPPPHGRVGAEQPVSRRRSSASRVASRRSPASERRRSGRIGITSRYERDAEPAIRPQVEAVRRELKQLEKSSGGK